MTYVTFPHVLMDKAIYMTTINFRGMGMCNPNICLEEKLEILSEQY